jgi:hypothetical protein
MTIRDVVARHVQLETPGGDLDAVVEAWEETGLGAHEVEEWLRVRCFDPATAEDLSDAGVTADLAGIRTEAGRGTYLETIAFKVCVGDLEVDEARSLVGED